MQASFLEETGLPLLRPLLAPSGASFGSCWLLSYSWMEPGFVCLLGLVLPPVPVCAWITATVCVLFSEETFQMST